MAQRQGIYASAPIAKAKKTAYGNPVGTVTVLGVSKPPTVPEHMGQLHGLGPEAKQFHHPQVKGAHGFGHTASLRHGHLRVSGVTGSHQIGKRSKLK